MRYLLLIPVLIMGLISAPSSATETFQPYEAGQFEAALEMGEPIIVHVHASWCTVCRRQVRILEEHLQANEAEQVAAFRVNYDRERDFLSRYDVRRQANILVFRDGREVARVDYSADAGEIEAALNMARR